MRNLMIGSLALLFTACTGGKPDVTEDFTGLAGADEKSDAFSAKLKLVGSLDYGTTSDPVKYTGKPRFSAFKFGGHKGDQVAIDVRSSDGDAIAWLTDNSFKIIARNDDANGNTTDSHIAATLPGNSNASIITYYIIFRDYNVSPATFTVSLATTGGDFFSCDHDSDCIAVPEAACCHSGRKVGVNVDEIDAYEASVTCPAHQICPLFLILETRVAVCNAQAHKCEMVAPDGMSCGGHTVNPHACPKDFHCYAPQGAVDVPGTCKSDSCVDNVLCAGSSHWDKSACGCVANACIQNVLCMQGAHFDNVQCKCVPDADQCGGCAKGQYCSLCWGKWACIPNGALC